MPYPMVKPRPENLVSYRVFRLPSIIFGFCIFGITSGVVLNLERNLAQLGTRTYTYLGDRGLSGLV